MNRLKSIAIFQFAVLFTSTEINVVERIWVYDQNDLLADIGGFLGLLLGASCFTLADMLVTYLEGYLRRGKKAN
jgi:hypothetical protein